MKSPYRVASVHTGEGRKWVVYIKGRREATTAGHDAYFRTRGEARDYVVRHKRMVERAAA